MDHFCDLSDEFDLEAAAGQGKELYVIDQGADNLNCFGPCYFIAEQVLEVRDLPPVNLSKVGMQPHWLVLKTRNFRRDLGLSQFQCTQFSLYARAL